MPKKTKKESEPSPETSDDETVYELEDDESLEEQQTSTWSKARHAKKEPLIRSTEQGEGVPEELSDFDIKMNKVVILLSVYDKQKEKELKEGEQTILDALVNKIADLIKDI